MISDPSNLNCLLSEYTNLFSEAGRKNELNWDDLKEKLIVEGDWTGEAASALIDLVREYGSFVLRNAAALSLALDIEDGERGF